ncbi:Protoporphyrinogen oxidase, C-terminal domain [Phytophthora cactorum]|nr:Protoporphyrinogen oxidase, C-terminal domain [Phytophthora cactorum]
MAAAHFRFGSSKCARKKQLRPSDRQHALSEGLALLLSSTVGWSPVLGTTTTWPTTCSSSADLAWQTTCPVRTANNTNYVSPTGMTSAEINVDENNAAVAYKTARQSALKLSAVAGNTAMSGMRKKSDNWYKQSLASFTTYICVKSSSEAELERCVDPSSSDAVRDINGNNCKWDDVVPGGSEARRQVFTDADVTTATKWMSTGYPSSLAPFVAPGTVMGVLTALGCIGFVVLRCVFNRCGGREPNEKGYTRCNIIIPTLTFLVCSLAVFICMVVTAALNTNISDGVEDVLHSLKATLENANIFAVNAQLKNSDWIATDGATLRKMIADFGSIYYNHGSFPTLTCDPATSETFCLACPDRVCGSPVTFFVNNTAAAISASSDVVGDAVSLLLSSFVVGGSALNSTLRTALHGHCRRTHYHFNDLSFSRSALVVCIFLFGMIASILGIIAIVKNACTTKTTKWVHLLHVSWSLGVLVCVLSFVLSASLLAVGAVWYDSCEYMKLLHQDMSPYASTQMASMANACFNGSNILAPLGLDVPLSFSCNVEDEYKILQGADTTSMQTIVSTYGEIVSNFDLTDFSFNSTKARSLVSKLSTAAEAAKKKPVVKFTQENVLTPWLAYSELSSLYGCGNRTTDELPVCYMTGLCESNSTANTTTQASCQLAFYEAYEYLVAFDKASAMLDEMRETLLGDTGKTFPDQWNYTVSISEFATNYFTKITALKTGPLSKMLGKTQARCSGDCAWANLSFDAINEALCNNVLGTTLAISLCALFLSLFLLPLIISAIILQKRLRGVAKGTYDQLEARLQELERRAKQQKRRRGGKSAGGLSALGGLFKGKKFQSTIVVTKTMAAVTRDVVVLGGGISGLTLAYFLRQALPKAVADATRIRVLDASTASGREGFLFEEGPRGFRPSRNGAEMLRLMQAVDPAAQARYILRDGKVEKLPTSLLEALRWPLSLAVARAALHELFVKPGAMEDESVYKFIARRFSPLVAEKLLDPMASGIFGGDIRKLSIRSCFPMLVDLEKKHGSVVKGMLFGGSKGDDTLLDGTNKSAFVKKHEKSISVSFTDGMSTLMDALADSIKNDPMADLQLNTKVTRLEVHGQNNTSSKGPRFVVESKDPTSGEIQEPIRASHVFSTIPACYLAPVVKDTAPGLAEALNEIKFVDMSMVHVGYNEKVLMTDGFGYLIPTSEREKVMSGGAHFREVASLPEGELERNAMDALKRHLGITQMPDYVRAMTMTNGIPQYHVGFGQTLQRIEKQATRSAPGLFLGGNSFYGIGLADCVTHSKHLALKFAKSVSS